MLDLHYPYPLPEDADPAIYFEEEREAEAIDKLLEEIVHSKEAGLKWMFEEQIRRAMPPSDFNTRLLTSLQAIRALDPSDYQDAVLCANIVITQEQMVRWMNESHQTLGVAIDGLAYANAAMKLVDSVSRVTEVRDRRRNRGKQQIRVEHVHVNDGGQAIVGNVEHGPPGVAEEAPERAPPPAAVRHRVRRGPR